MGDSESDGKPAIEYTCEAQLIDEFQTRMRDPKQKDAAIKYLYESVLDETILGVVFEVHFAQKTGIQSALDGQPEEPRPFVVNEPGVDVFGVNNNTKVAMNCVCPVCERSLGASRFAPHLASCMGMGRISSRIASQRNASTTRDSGNYFGTGISDDEHDASWTDKKPRKQSKSKKNGKSTS